MRDRGNNPNWEWRLTRKRGVDEFDLW